MIFDLPEAHALVAKQDLPIPAWLFAWGASIATGNSTPRRASPAATASRSAPKGKRGACTPITERPASR